MEHASISHTWLGKWLPLLKDASWDFIGPSQVLCRFSCFWMENKIKDLFHSKQMTHTWEIWSESRLYVNLVWIQCGLILDECECVCCHCQAYSIWCELSKLRYAIKVMETGFASHFEHKDDSCTDMAEKQLSKRLKAPLWIGSQNIWLNLQIKEGSWESSMGVPCFWEIHGRTKHCHPKKDLFPTLLV